MNSCQLLAGRIREVYLYGTWIANTNYKDQTLELSLDQATFRQGSSNSVALLVYHVNYYLSGIIEVFEKGELNIRDKFSFDMPVLSSQEEWQHWVSAMLNNAEKLATWVENMDEVLLQAPFVDEKYGTYQRNLEGVIEHSYYHLGQIALLNKWARER